MTFEINLESDAALRTEENRENDLQPHDVILSRTHLNLADLISHHINHSKSNLEQINHLKINRFLQHVHSPKENEHVR